MAQGLVTTASNKLPPPPVTTAEQAVCLVRLDLEREWSGMGWKGLKPAATREDGTWLVTFMDSAPGIRRGGGEVTLDSRSGNVTRRLGYR